MYKRQLEARDKFDSSSRVKVVLVSEIVFAISKSYTLFEVRCQYPSLILSSDPELREGDELREGV